MSHSHMTVIPHEAHVLLPTPNTGKLRKKMIRCLNEQELSHHLVSACVQHEDLSSLWDSRLRIPRSLDWGRKIKVNAKHLGYFRFSVCQHHSLPLTFSSTTKKETQNNPICLYDSNWVHCISAFSSSFIILAHTTLNYLSN